MKSHLALSFVGQACIVCGFFWESTRNLIFLNPFYAIGLFLYPLKNKAKGFQFFFRGYEKKQVA